MRMNHRFYRTGLITLLASGGLLLAVCGNAAVPGRAATPVAPGARAVRTAHQPGNRALLAAGKTALAQRPGGTVTGIERERGGAYWEVKVVAQDGQRTKFRVSADGSRIQGSPRQSHQSAKSRRKWQRRIDAAKLDYAQAAKKVLAERTGHITELELDDHHGTVVWEADVRDNGSKYKVRINARDGAVTMNKRD